MDKTTRGIRYAQDSDPRDQLTPAEALQALAEDVDRRLPRAMTTAQRIALSATSQGAGTAFDPVRAERWDGCLVFDTDLDTLFRWDEVAQVWWSIDRTPASRLFMYANYT